MLREIPGIDALSNAFPKEWLLYASLNCYPRNQSPMEIDALVVINDRVLLLELKDWNGTLTQRGDQWFVGGKSRGRSPVVLGEEKAKKLKTVLRTEIPTLTSLYVEARVVLTASATRDGIAEQEKPYVWTIAQACSIADPNARAALLPPRKLGLLKAYNFEQDFDRVTNNTKVFQPLEADWGGYRVSESNVVVHPNGVWAEHKAERNNEARMKALVRIWAFDRLPPGLNSSDRRKLIAHRETKAVAHLMTGESPLLERSAILRDIGPSNDEILTNHFDLRELPPNWNTWDRFLERSQADFDISDRILVATTLLSLIADLHKGGIAHRDLGPRCIWVGGPSKMALNGFMCCQLPGEESVEDWLTTLKGYAVHSAKDEATSINGSGRQRDVFSVGQLVAGVLRDASTCESTALPLPLPDELSHFQEWIDSATHVDPDVRFSDGVAMAARFASLAESVGTIEIDQELLDRHETNLIPYVAWPQREALVQDARRSVYLSVGPDEEQVVVKVWNGIHRNISTATDLALLRLLESAARVQASPVVGLPVFRKIGLSPIGPFVVYRHIAGNSLESVESLPTNEALSISAKLLTCVVALHELECEHGDIATKNVLLNFETKDVFLLDAFDISPVGTGEIRTPSLCPIGWEKLDQRSLDRYATLRVVKETLEKCADARLSDAIDSIDREIARPIVETLEVVLAIVRQANAAISKPARPTFTIYHPSGSHGFFRPDGDGYFLTHRVDTEGQVRYALCGIDRELVFSTRDGMLSGSEFLRLPFGALSYASRKGIKVSVDISVLPGRASGLLPLFDFAKANAGPVSTAARLVSAPPVTNLDVPRYWDRLIDLEASNKLELEIVEEIAFSDGIGIYTYEPSGSVPDFDPESSIDVYVPPAKRIGELDYGATDTSNTLAIRGMVRRLSAGDVVLLADRKDQTSIDRRSKAVRKVLDDQAAVPNLIAYFSKPGNVTPTDYRIEAAPDSLTDYGLNSGQQDAFRHLLRFGPVGLLQGPPGTGKTRFIASFVHWLMTEGGARRILIASQSHEAVNNAIEALVNLYKRRGGKPNLLRIGSKGITAKIRPYHSAELRERFRIRFDAAIKNRVTLLATQKGISRPLTSAVFDIDVKLGDTARKVKRLRRLAEESTDVTALDRDRYISELKRAESALIGAAKQFDMSNVDVHQPLECIERAFETALERHPPSSSADLSALRQIIALARDWSSSMASKYRNFDEFLAKTRSIVTATCVGVGETKIRIDSTTFDWVIVDEAARCTSSELAVPIQLGRRVLLVGDHLQLMPMIDRALVEALSEEFPGTGRDDLIRSDFERAFLSPYGENIGRRLTEQYRMHPAICKLVSNTFYEPHAVKLVTSSERSPSIEIEGDLPDVLATPICWIDTFSLVNRRESQLPNSTTFHNDAEVGVVLQLLNIISQNDALVSSLAKLEDETPIGVICMYSGQKRKIELACARHAWTPKFRRLLRVDTVDAYQGKENALVILSLVRSNASFAPGHVRSDNRCNVAVSRARERLIIVGDCAMWNGVSEGSPMRRALNHIRQHPEDGKVLSAGVLE